MSKPYPGAIQFDGDRVWAWDGRNWVEMGMRETSDGAEAWLPEGGDFFPESMRDPHMFQECVDTRCFVCRNFEYIGGDYQHWVCKSCRNSITVASTQELNSRTIWHVIYICDARRKKLLNRVTPAAPSRMYVSQHQSPKSEVKFERYDGYIAPEILAANARILQREKRQRGF